MPMQNDKFSKENGDLPSNFGRSSIFKQPYGKPYESWRYSVYLSVVFSHPITGQVGSLGVILGARLTWQIHISHMYLRTILVEQGTVYTIIYLYIYIYTYYYI
jgi:hypothetical protein